MEKKNIDKMRQRGGSADIGTSEEGAIDRMITLGDRVLMLKKRAVYEFRLADSFDPERQNPDLPFNSQRFLLNIGTDSELFCRTFLTASPMLKPEFMPPTFDCPKAIWKTLDLVKELVAMNEEIIDFKKVYQEAIDGYEDRRRRKMDHAVPAIPDIQSRSVTIFQKADHVMQAQMEMIRMFYPDFNINSYYGKFLPFASTKYGGQDGFTVFLKGAVPYIELTRAIRNCLEHRRSEIQLLDFELQLTGDIMPPTIAIDYIGNTIQCTSLVGFLSELTESMTAIFEAMIVLLCERNLREDRIAPVVVREIPPERRVNKYVRYAFWLNLGEGGFYYQ